MIGGLAGLATQGGFMGNSNGIVGGLAGMALNQFSPMGGQGGGQRPKPEEDSDGGPSGGQGGFRQPGGAGGYPGIGGMGGLLVQGLPGGMQGPAQGPNTPVRRYGDQYMPYGPGGGGIPPTPMASMYGGPQMGQAGGLLGNANFFSDPMTIKRVS